MKRVQVFAFDLDGTILEAEERICQEAKDALIRAANSGVRLVVATGRGLESIDEILGKNGLAPQMGFLQAILAGEHKIFFVRNGGYVPLEDWNERMRKNFLQLLPLGRKILTKMKQELEQHKFKSEWHNTPKQQREAEIIDLTFASLEEADEARRYVCGRLSSFTSELFCRRHGQWVQLKYREAGKGRTLLELARALRIESSEILTVGNSQNDEDMLDGRYGFRSAAVSNAEESIKKVVLRNGGYVAQFPLGRGVAEILREIK